MQNETKLMIGALARAVAEKPLVVPDPVDWSMLCHLSNIHGVGPLVYDGLQRAGVLDRLPDTQRNQLKVQYHHAIFRHTQMEHMKVQLQAALEEAGVKHIFLKGSVLKYSYPVPELRTMCDMDILVHTADFGKIDEVAKKLGGKALGGDGNHRNYAFGGGVSVEFHPNLLHHATPVGTDINPGWQYAKDNSAGCAMELTEEGFYLNTVCHLANHFVDGGVGVRFVLDVWVNRHLHKPVPDRTFVEKELTRFDLLDFTQKIEDLSEAWFADAEMSPQLEELEDYILTSGSHGTTDRAMLNALSLSPGGNRFSALMKKTFYPRAELEDRFPWCKGRPLLLPAAWCCRAFRAVTVHGDQILAWSKGTGDITREEVARNREKLARMGIRCSRKHKGKK